MSIAEAYDMPVARQPLVPPSPPRAPDNMTAVRPDDGDARQPDRQPGASAPTRRTSSAAASSAAASFILNTPDAIRHVLVDNYENYTRTPAGIRVLRPMLGEGPADRGRPRLEAPAPDAGAGLHAARGRRRWFRTWSAATDETVAKLKAASNAPVDLREVDAADDAGDRRPHHVLVRHGSRTARPCATS